MVDRIVPATTDADRAEIARLTGREDAWPIMTEPFTQWVVEDHFSRRPAGLASVGVELVDNVEPFELMKLRMLNGSHSTLAYLGYLGGYQYVSEAIADPRLAETDPRPDDRGGRADPRARRRPSLTSIAIGCWSASPIRAQASDLADRDGRHAEAAAASAGHYP